jgi:excisionase family DNA binding protein
MGKKTKDSPSKEILNTREAAAFLKVTIQTIKNYIYSGKLKAIKTPGGHHRILKSDLHALGFIIEEYQKKQKDLTLDQPNESYNHLLDSLVSTVQAFVRALEARDIISSGHSERVAQYSHTVGKSLCMTEKELRELKLAAILHDVGKIGVSENILGKSGRLTEQEYFLVKKHPEIGGGIVAEVRSLEPIVASIRHHHERFDCTGYPDEIGGTDIDLKARIIAVAETYDFLRSDLPFRSAYSVGDTPKS